VRDRLREVVDRDAEMVEACHRLSFAGRPAVVKGNSRD
jgi:hypothetical protein